MSFLSFKSTTNPFGVARWLWSRKVLVDAFGAPMGMQASENGPDGIWGPVYLSAAQIAAPTAAMVADLYARYQLNVAPYTCYRSDGTTLQMMPSTGDSASLAAVVANVGVPLFSIGTLTPTGSNQATAALVITQTVILGNAATTTGVQYPVAAVNVGIPINFINNGTAAVHIYGNAGDIATIDGTAGAIGVTLTSGHRCVFTAEAAGLIVSGPEGGVTS